MQPHWVGKPRVRDRDPVAFWTLLPVVAMVGCSITVMAINGEHLASVGPFCIAYGPNTTTGLNTTCVEYAEGCLWSNDDQEFSTCYYAWAVGIIGIMTSLLSLTFVCRDCNGKGNLGTGIWHMGWWTVAGAVLVKRDQEMYDSIPQDNWRKGIIAVCWLGAAMAVLQIAGGAYLTYQNRRRNIYLYHDQEQPSDNMGSTRG